MTVKLEAIPKTVDTDWLISPIAQIIVNKDSVYCLGWNEKGTCALFQIVDGGLRGSYALRFLIIDAVEDNILFDQHVWADEANAKSDDPQDIAAAISHSKTGIDFGYMCNIQGIDKPNGSAIQKFPLNYKGKGVTLNIETAPGKIKAATGAKSLPGTEYLDYKVIVKISGMGSKTVTRNKDVLLSDIQPEGYFLNPYNARILIVYRMTVNSIEGEPNVTFGYTGCQLATGFK